MSTETDTALFARKMALAGRLAAATGITTMEALGLIAMLGSDWSSLVREATVMMRNRPDGIR
jgi:hypothetical protein